MRIQDILSETDVLTDVKAADRTRIIQDLALRAAAGAGVEANLATQELLKREALGSTGVGLGIAIPHARLAEIGRPFGVFARLKRAIDFDAIDARPVDIVFLLLLPKNNQPDALAAVARALRDPARLEKVRNAEDAAALYGALTS